MFGSQTDWRCGMPEASETTCGRSGCGPAAVRNSRAESMLWNQERAVIRQRSRGLDTLASRAHPGAAAPPALGGVVAGAPRAVLVRPERCESASRPPGSTGLRGFVPSRGR